MTVDNSGRHIQSVLRWLILGLTPGVALVALLSTPAPVTLGELPGATLEPALLAVGRLAGVALTGWLVLSQLVYTAAVLTRTRWLADTLRPVTLPLVRHAVAGLTTITISLNAVAAVEAPTETTIVSVDTSDLRQEATPTPNLQPLVEIETEAPCALEDPIGSYSAPLTWLVRPGDHLWKIAGEHLSIVLERAPTSDEHARYWVEVVKAAQPIIRSGDPDLIYPDEEIPLPPTLDAGVRP